MTDENGAKSKKIEFRQIIFSAFFYLNNIKVKHERETFSILALLSQFGGLMASLLNGLGIIGMVINRELFIGKLVNHMYLVKRPPSA